MPWHGQAFSYLMHHPKGGQQESDSYYKDRQSRTHQREVEQSSRGNVGTWHGPAPRGHGIAPRHVRVYIMPLEKYNAPESDRIVSL